MPPISHASRSRLSPLGLALLVTASVGWGLNFPIMKHLLTEWPPLSSRGLCGIVGAVALALIALARARAAQRIPADVAGLDARDRRLDRLDGTGIAVLHEPLGL